MVGQVDGDESSDDSEDDPRSYRNKTVGQRMFIISAGVIMNVLLAFVCFILVYQVNGKTRTSAVVGGIDSGAASFEAGVRWGAQVQQIGDVENPYFDRLMTTVVFSRKGEKLKFVGWRPGDKTPLATEVEPRLGPDGLRPVIGIGSASRLELITRRRALPTDRGPYIANSPAARADPPLEFGDVILACSDPADPSKVTELPRDARNTQADQRDYFEFRRRMQLLAGQEVVLRVRRAGPDGTVVDVKVPPAFHQTLKVCMTMGQVVALREGSPAAKAGLRVPDRVNNFKGDRIYKVSVPEADGSVTEFEEPGPERAYDPKTALDPERLRFQLQQWSARLGRAGAAVPKKVTLYVDRHRTKGGLELEKTEIVVDWDDDWTFDRIEPLNLDSPFAIPELGLAYRIRPIVAGVDPHGPAAGLLQVGDEIKQIQITSNNGVADRTTDWVSLKDNWANASWSLQHPEPLVKVALKVQREKTEVPVEIVPQFDTSWPLIERGWIFMTDERLQKARHFWEAIEFGLSDTWTTVKQVGQMLWGIATGRLSVKNLGGPIAIATTAYRIAGVDLWEFIFFLGMVSVNLAVINFLPIPVLDGGHMVFLCYEKLFRRPAPESVRVGATYAGLALILLLIGFVVYLDLTRRYF
ncbi:MAG: site-2 protease family protein, partial [Gemmataceae bacterium]|nr:site-2 protease family protein [Gemmataceae bacterium]